jgi:hypothetical protein
MSRGRIGQREVRRFWAVDTTGQRYQLVDRVDLLDVRTHGDLNAAPLEGLHEIRTSDGLSVNFLGNGRYEIVQTGEILTEE